MTRGTVSISVKNIIFNIINKYMISIFFCKNLVIKIINNITFIFNTLLIPKNMLLHNLYSLFYVATNF